MRFFCFHVFSLVKLVEQIQWFLVLGSGPLFNLHEKKEARFKEFKRKIPNTDPKSKEQIENKFHEQQEIYLFTTIHQHKKPRTRKKNKQILK